MALRTTFAWLAITLPGLALAEDYVGTLKVPQSSSTPSGIYSFSTTPGLVSVPGETGMKLKLGYKYSRYFAVEGEVMDFGRSSATDPFSSPANLASAFRSTGFGVDTIAMLPVWRFSFYGRMGAYRADVRNPFGATSLGFLPSEAYSRGTRLRYGLGMRYDITRSLGMRAEYERNAAFGSPFASESDTADQVSVGVTWRF
jgi:hypothetical protein